MDAARALGRRRRVGSSIEELRQESPDPDTLAEGRIVLAGSLADRGKLAEAIALLESNGAAKPRRNPGERHLRQWYMLGDLYDRSGDVPRAPVVLRLVAERRSRRLRRRRARLMELGAGAVAPSAALAAEDPRRQVRSAI